MDLKNKIIKKNNNSNLKIQIKDTHNEKLIPKLMEQFNISYDEAEMVLSKIVERKTEKIVNEQKIDINNNLNDIQNTKSSSNTNINQNNMNSKIRPDSTENKTDKTKNIESTENKTDKTKNIDSILSNIIPNYNENISIELKNVDLTFNVSNEKVDTIKESFIRTLKRDKSKKIKIHVLKDITFKIYKGEKIGIIGYNGAGKSTLLNVISGIYPPDKGTVVTNGNLSPLLSLGAGFDYNYSGRKNIILNGAVLGYNREFIEEKMDEIIEFSELGEFIDIPIKNYSSGMLAKLGFSIATAVEPDILIVDEILGVGDVSFQKKSSDKIKSLMDGGTTVLFVSHSIPQVRSICDKAIWIDKGEVREIGEVNKVCDNYLKDAEKANNQEKANIQFK